MTRFPGRLSWGSPRGFSATCGLILLTLCATAASAADSVPKLTPAEMRQDLLYVKNVWKPQDKSFSPAATLQFDAIIDEAVAGADKLDSLGLWMRIARAVSVSHNGHTTVDDGNPPFPGLPINVWWFRDGLYIVQTQPGYTQLLGARIEKIGRDDPEQALAAVAPYISGNSRWVKTQSPGYLRIPALLHRLGITDSDTKTELTVQLRGGDSRQVSLPLASQPDPTGGWAALRPADASQKDRWPGVLDSVKSVPLTYGKQVDVDSRWLSPDQQVLYIRSSQIQGLAGSDLSQKLAMILLTQVAAVRPKSVIVDLRFNGGGNFANTILFAQALPKLLPPGGHDYVLVNGCTFSAAIVTAAMIKEAGGSKVVFLGTPMGDDDRFWAEGQPVPLPHSKIRLRPAPLFEDWGQGCRDMRRCFWPDVIWGPKSPISLRPDEEISPTFAEYAAGRDPVLERALALSRP